MYLVSAKGPVTHDACEYVVFMGGGDLEVGFCLSHDGEYQGRREVVQALLFLSPGVKEFLQPGRLSFFYWQEGEEFVIPHFFCGVVDDQFHECWDLLFDGLEGLGDSPG